MVDGSSRRSATSASQGDASSSVRDLAEVRGQDVGALEIADDRLDFSARDPGVPVHANPADAEQARVVGQARGPIARERDEGDDEQRPGDAPAEERA